MAKSGNKIVADKNFNTSRLGANILTLPNPNPLPETFLPGKTNHVMRRISRSGKDVWIRSNRHNRNTLKKIEIPFDETKVPGDIVFNPNKVLPIPEDVANRELPHELGHLRACRSWKEKIV